MTTTIHRTRHNQKIIITHAGRTASLRQWCILTGASYHTLYSRFKANPAPGHVFKGIEITAENINITETAV